MGNTKSSFQHINIYIKMNHLHVEHRDLFISPFPDKSWQYSENSTNSTNNKHRNKDLNTELLWSNSFSNLRKRSKKLLLHLINLSRETEKRQQEDLKIIWKNLERKKAARRGGKKLAALKLKSDFFSSRVDWSNIQF